MHESVAKSPDVRAEAFVVVVDCDFVRVVVKEANINGDDCKEAKHFEVLHRQALVLLN